MKCRKWDKRLPSLLDEGMESPARRELEAHLRQCGNCRNRWALLSRLREEAAGLGGLAPGDGVWQGIRQELAGPARGRGCATAPAGRWLFQAARRWAPAAAMAAATVVALCLWQFYRPVSGRQPLVEVVTASADTTAEIAAHPKTGGQAAPGIRSIIVAKRAARRPGLSSGHRRRYLMDDLALSQESRARHDRTRYLLPSLSSQQAGNRNPDQQYIMPAVYVAVREPF